MKLQQLAEQARDYQQSRGISDTEMCRRFTGLGSTKTYKRILEGDTAELDLERWETDYRQVLSLIEIEAQSIEIDEPVYDDLKHISQTRLAVIDAMNEKGNNRLVIVEGPSGSGKSTAGRALAARFGRKIVLAEADETWKESPNAMLGGLLRALGVKEIPQSSEGRKTKLVEHLIANPACLVVDEAHHLGPRTFNLVKTLLNQTVCQFVFLAIPTLFRKLESAAYEEAKQLTHNRMCERVRLAGPAAAETEKFLARRLKFDTDTLKPCAEICATRAPQFGNWNFVNLVTRKCRGLVGKGSVDLESFTKAMDKAQQTR
jgi:type II secretory pathway predicted ATPase ExeA